MSNVLQAMQWLRHARGLSQKASDAPTTISSTGGRRPIYSGTPQYAQCAPGQCYLFEEKVTCAVTDFSCKEGTRQIWSYRPQFYRVDNSELMINLDKKLCPNSKNCLWQNSNRRSY